MSLSEIIGRLLGLEDAQAIEGARLSLAAPWAQSAPAWLLFGCLGLAAVTLAFYLRWQSTRRARSRLVLAAFRAALLSLLLLVLAEPVLTVRVTSRVRPALWLLVDGTDSMAVADEMPEAVKDLIP